MPVKQNRLHPGSQHLKLYQKKLSHILLKGKRVRTSTKHVYVCLLSELYWLRVDLTRLEIGDELR